MLLPFRQRCEEYRKCRYGDLSRQIVSHTCARKAEQNRQQPDGSRRAVTAGIHIRVAHGTDSRPEPIKGTQTPITTAGDNRQRNNGVVIVAPHVARARQVDGGQQRLRQTIAAHQEILYRRPDGWSSIRHSPRPIWQRYHGGLGGHRATGVAERSPLLRNLCISVCGIQLMRVTGRGCIFTDGELIASQSCPHTGA